MKKTIQQIKDLASVTDNSYLMNKINKLEKQITKQQNYAKF